MTWQRLGMLRHAKRLVTVTARGPAADLHRLHQTAAQAEQPSAASSAHLLQTHQSWLPHLLLQQPIQQLQHFSDA